MVEHSWWIVTVGSSSLSIAGGLFIIYTYGAISKIQNSTRELLVYLTIADIATAYGNFVGAIRFSILYYGNGDKDQISKDDFVCTAQSFLTTFSNLCSFIWTSLIAVNLFVLFMNNGHDLYKSSITVRVFCHIGGWICPGMLLVTALSLGKLGEDHATSGWCWITSKLEKREKIMWMFLTGKGLEILTYLITAVLYVLLKGLTWRRRKKDPTFNWSNVTSLLRKEDENFCLAWMVLYVVRFWGTIRFFMSICMDEYNDTAENVDNVLIYFQSYGDSAQAFWNCVLYCLFDKTVTNHVFVRNRTSHFEGMQGISDLIEQNNEHDSE